MQPTILLRYLRLPLHTAPLVLIVLFSFGLTLLDHVVDGRPEPPVLSLDLANPIAHKITSNSSTRAGPAKQASIAGMAAST